LINFDHFGGLIIIVIIFVRLKLGNRCLFLIKAYSAANSILSKTKYVSEIVRLNLIESYVFLIIYALEAVTLSLSEQRQFAICLNNLYRRIFGMNKWESVKRVQYFCGKLDFVNEYLRRLYSLGF